MQLYGTERENHDKSQKDAQVTYEETYLEVGNVSHPWDGCQNTDKNKGDQHFVQLDLEKLVEHWASSLYEKGLVGKSEWELGGH